MKPHELLLHRARDQVPEPVDGEVARHLGVSERTLYRRLKKLRKTENGGAEELVRGLVS